MVSWYSQQPLGWFRSSSSVRYNIRCDIACIMVYIRKVFEMTRYCPSFEHQEQLCGISLLFLFCDSTPLISQGVADRNFCRAPGWALMRYDVPFGATQSCREAIRDDLSSMHMTVTPAAADCATYCLAESTCCSMQQTFWQLEDGNTRMVACGLDDLCEHPGKCVFLYPLTGLMPSHPGT